MDHEKAINDLRSRVGDKRRELREAEAKLDEACSAMLMERHGLSKGSIIVSKGTRYLFHGFEKPASLAWLKVRQIKKDGTVSDFAKTMYAAWEIEKPTD